MAATMNSSDGDKFQVNQGEMQVTMATEKEGFEEGSREQTAPTVDEILVDDSKRQEAGSSSDNARTPDPEDLPKDDDQCESDQLTGSGSGSGSTSASSKSSKELGKAKRREDRSIEHILKALGSLNTTEEKLAALCKKYSDLHEESRIVQNSLKQNQRKLAVVMREKDQLQSEHSKTILAKSKLESLCRELQRHNKLIKEESLARAREEEEKRKEVSAKFTATISDIQSQMQDNQSRNEKLKNENIELAMKLKNLIEQYEKREEHIEKLLKHKELEQHLGDAKLAESNLLMAQEKERGLKEKKMLLEELDHYRKKVVVMEQGEKQLKAQLSLYTEKYEEFQSTLTKSNEVFGSFKTEMDKMTKKIKKLDKETNMWKTRWESSNKALLEMADEKQKSDKEMGRLQTKLQCLEKLCRALQAERKNPDATPQDNDTLGMKSSDYNVDAVTGDGDIEPTKTPPNTPSSRASPNNVVEIDPLDTMVNGHVIPSDQSASDDASVSAPGQSEPAVLDSQPSTETTT